MPLWNLTFEKVEEIKRSREEKNNELLALEKTDIKELWLTDLNEFLTVLDKVQEEEEEERKAGDDKSKVKNKGQKAKKKVEKKVGKDAK